MASSRDSSPAPPSYRSREGSPVPSRDGDDSEFPPGRKNTIHLTPYSRPPPRSSNSSQAWIRQDPRSSSMQSLVPSESASDTGRRKLLLIYIHGFMGNDASFKSFPAHIHNIITVTLAESHTVHTKIYPKYQTRRPIEFARDDFSNWLCVHENDTTDIILLGHSMGGMLAGEVALLPPYSRTSSEAFRHRILGVITFDTPFLGLHPGVIGTGISSLFRSKPKKPQDQQSGDHCATPSPGPSSPPGQSSSEIDCLFNAPTNDPNYNPTFANDKILAERTGWEKAAYFINKHSDGLTRASKQYFWSHIEFGGCLADYAGLQRRYNQIRALEDIDDLNPRRDANGRLQRRVRFVNYYSASSGRLKPDKKANSDGRPPAVEMQNLTIQDEKVRAPQISPAHTPRISVEAPEETSPSHQSHTAETSTETTIHEDPSQSTEVPPPFVEIPSVPAPPPAFNPGLYTTVDSLKAARKEHTQAVKSYEQALKARESAIKERDKLAKQQIKASAKEMAKQVKTAAKALAKAEKEKRRQRDSEERAKQQQEDTQRKEQLKRKATINPEVYDRQLELERTQQQQELAGDSSGGTGSTSRKKQKDRKFCTLPSKDANGLRDSVWIRIFMEGVDEVEAHTTLFLMSETYQRIVGDTAARIEEWVNEDRTAKLLLQEQGFKEEDEAAAGR